MKDKTKEQARVSKVEISLELMHEIVEDLINEKWFSRKDDGSITDENGVPIKFEDIQRAVEHWFRVLVTEITAQPDWHMDGRSGWPDFDTNPTCWNYWCGRKPADGTHLCQTHFEEAQEGIES